MQWKSIVKDEIPDAKEIIVTWGTNENEWFYECLNFVEGTYENAEGITFDLSEPCYTHYLILEPPEIE